MFYRKHFFEKEESRQEYLLPAIPEILTSFLENEFHFIFNGESGTGKLNLEEGIIAENRSDK